MESALKEAKKLLSFADLTSEDDMEFVDVETKRGIVRLGTVSSLDILEWLDDNADPVKAKFSGLRLLVKSIIADPATGARIGDKEDSEIGRREAQERALKSLKRRDARENGLLVRKALELNGLRAKSKESEIVEALKNDSSETESVDSPSDSPLPPADSTQTTS